MKKTPQKTPHDLGIDFSPYSPPNIFSLWGSSKPWQLCFTIENNVKTVFFRRFLGYLIHQWSNSNAPHTHFTVIFLKSFFFMSVVHLWHSPFDNVELNKCPFLYLVGILFMEQKIVRFYLLLNSWHFPLTRFGQNSDGIPDLSNILKINSLTNISSDKLKELICTIVLKWFSNYDITAWMQLVNTSENKVIHDNVCYHLQCAQFKEFDTANTCFVQRHGYKFNWISYWRLWHIKS